MPDASLPDMSLILDSLAMGLLYCDRQGIVRFVNRAYADLLGRKPEALIGLPITIAIPHSRAHEVMASGKPEMGDLCQLGLAQPVIVNRLPARDGTGQVMGMISQAIFREPAELLNLSARIERRSRKQGSQRRRFLASHPPLFTFENILGASEAIRKLKAQAKRYSAIGEPVLILGETGTGKELFAHAIHAESPAGRGPLICINCAAIPAELFEAELFGYEKGAFSGARPEGKPGQIELADGGSLFLDEIGELAPEIQAKLLRALDSGVVSRLGAINSRPVDFRLIAATNRPLESMLRTGAFREDLYYRLSTFVLYLPPLRMRKEDIMPIACAVLQGMGLEYVAFAPETCELMLRAAWPGNARQLRNAVVHAAAMRNGDRILPADFPAGILQPANAAASPLASAAREAEADAIRNALDLCGANVAAAARVLRISRSALYEKMRRYGVKPNRNPA
ncbi:MAG: sigma 54-interacting transcriptional regulator [Desulfovibrio sp.]|nr:sigma 54-interacting transcriptional regulator [Desulfovibrio sp.]